MVLRWADRRPAACRLGKTYFDDILSQIAATARLAYRPKTIPYYDAKTTQEKKARQVVFRLRLDPADVCDVFFNGRDGLRARYWISPIVGDDATRSVIRALTPMLLEEGRQPEIRDNAAPLSDEALRIALAMPSAKVWPFEGGDIPPQAGLEVARWQDNWHPDVGTRWRWMPERRDLEIKTALIDLDQAEHVPPSKRNRTEQIHRHGFT